MHAAIPRREASGPLSEKKGHCFLVEELLAKLLHVKIFVLVLNLLRSWRLPHMTDAVDGLGLAAGTVCLERLPVPKAMVVASEEVDLWCSAEPDGGM